MLAIFALGNGMNLKPVIAKHNDTLNLSVAVLALVVMLIQLLLFLERGFALITFPYDLTSGEGLLVRDALYIRNSLPLYTNPNEFPYIISIYPPFYAAVVALFSFVMGIGLGTARFVAVSSSLLTCGVIALIVYCGSRKWMIAVVSGLAYLSSLFVFQWSAFGRVDTLAVFCSVAAIYFIYQRVTLKNVILAAVFCVAAFYTKQTAVAASLAIALYLVLTNWRLGLAFITIVGASIAGVFLVLNGLTQGQFYLQTVAYNVQEYFVRALLSFIRALVILHPVSLILALLFIWLAWKEKNLKQLPIIFFVFAGLMTWTVGRAGSTVNHFLEFIAATTILVGLHWGQLELRKNMWSFLVPSFLVLQVMWTMSFPFNPFGRFYEPGESFTKLPTVNDRQACELLDNYVHNAQGLVLGEEVGILVENNKDVLGSAWMLNVLRGRDLVDKGLDQLEKKVTQKEFILILLHGKSYPSDFLVSVKSRYHLLNEIRCYFDWQVFAR